MLVRSPLIGNKFINDWEEKTNIKSSIVGEFLMPIRFLAEYDNIFLANVKNLNKGDFVLINDFYCVFIGYGRVDQSGMFKYIKTL